MDTFNNTEVRSMTLAATFVHALVLAVLAIAGPIVIGLAAANNCWVLCIATLAFVICGIAYIINQFTEKKPI